MAGKCFVSALVLSFRDFSWFDGHVLYDINEILQCPENIDDLLGSQGKFLFLLGADDYSSGYFL